MPPTNKSTKKRKHISTAPSSSPDPPLRVILSYGPLSDNHASVVGLLPTRALNVIKEELRQLCKQVAPAKPRRGAPHKAGHGETTSLSLCYGFGKDRTNAGRWYSRCETCKTKPKTHIQFKTPPLEHDIFQRLQVLFDIFDEIKAHPRPSASISPVKRKASSSPAKPPKKRRIADTIEANEIFDISSSLTLFVNMKDSTFEDVLFPRADSYFRLTDYKLLLEKQNIDYGRDIEFYDYHMGTWMPCYWDTKHLVAGKGTFLQIRYAD